MQPISAADRPTGRLTAPATAQTEKTGKDTGGYPSMDNNRVEDRLLRRAHAERLNYPEAQSLKSLLLGLC